MKEKGVNCMYLYIYIGKYIDLDNLYVLFVELCMLDDLFLVDFELFIMDWGSYYEFCGIDLFLLIVILL